MKTLIGAPLTDEQRELASTHHKLMFQFIKRRGLELNDWYDVVIFGYIRAIRLYNPEIKQDISSLARVCMRHAMLNEMKIQNAKKRDAQVCSLDVPSKDGGCLFHKFVPSDYSLEDAAISKIDAHEILAQILPTLTLRRRQALAICALGRDQTTAARRLGVSVRSYKGRLRMRDA